MKASEIKVANLKDFTDCMEAIESIEMDHRNVLGGRKAFFSGYATELTVVAQKKVDAIQRKMDTFNDEC